MHVQTPKTLPLISTLCKCSKSFWYGDRRSSACVTRGMAGLSSSASSSTTNAIFSSLRVLNSIANYRLLNQRPSARVRPLRLKLCGPGMCSAGLLFSPVMRRSVGWSLLLARLWRDHLRVASYLPGHRKPRPDSLRCQCDCDGR